MNKNLSNVLLIILMVTTFFLPVYIYTFIDGKIIDDIIYTKSSENVEKAPFIQFEEETSKSVVNGDVDSEVIMIRVGDSEKFDCLTMYDLSDTEDMTYAECTTENVTLYYFYMLCRAEDLYRNNIHDMQIKIRSDVTFKITQTRFAKLSTSRSVSSGDTYTLPILPTGYDTFVTGTKYYNMTISDEHLIAGANVQNGGSADLCIIYFSISVEGGEGYGYDNDLIYFDWIIGNDYYDVEGDIYTPSYNTIGHFEIQQWAFLVTGIVIIISLAVKYLFNGKKR